MSERVLFSHIRILMKSIVIYFKAFKHSLQKQNQVWIYTCRENLQFSSIIESSYHFLSWYWKYIILKTQHFYLWILKWNRSSIVHTIISVCITLSFQNITFGKKWFSATAEWVYMTLKHWKIWFCNTGTFCNEKNWLFSTINSVILVLIRC